MSYALITGANKGIGRSIAIQLAERRINLLLIARDEPALKRVAEELTEKYSIEVAFKSIDLSLAEASQDIHHWCVQNNYEVKYLINNAGYGLSGPFERYPISEHINMMEVNMNALVSLCYLFLPSLKKQPIAYILNIASTAAYQAVPYLSVYAASKAFVLHFSRALHYELRDTSVSVTTISPGATKTGFDARAKLGPKALKTAAKLQMTSDEVARISVAAMLNHKTEGITGFINKVGGAFVWLLPKKIVEKMAAGIYQ
ncbi:MAG: SDR family oxidoreductase [Flavisolibacter sp.]